MERTQNSETQEGPGDTISQLCLMARTISFPVDRMDYVRADLNMVHTETSTNFSGHMGQDTESSPFYQLLYLEIVTLFLL